MLRYEKSRALVQRAQNQIPVCGPAALRHVGGEFDSVLRAVGGIDRLIDWEQKAPEIDLMRYMDDKTAKEDKVFDNPKLMKTPVVRNGKQADRGLLPGDLGNLGLE